MVRWILFLSSSALFAAGPQVIQKRCLSCHNDTAKMGNLSLVTRAGAERVLSGRLLARIDAGQMPPGGGLTDEEKTQVRDWLNAGAVWDGIAARPRAGADWWSLQPLRKREGSIDAFIETALRAKGLALSAPADRRTLIRRVTFDLTGLPPTPTEIAAFVNDTSADAYEQLVDRLLSSPDYGERWGRHWLDVIRYGESNGYEQNHIRANAWPFRDYVIQAFNSDTPFPRFILEQLAGDVVAKDNPAVEAATGFLVAGPHDTVGNQNEAARRQQRADDHDDIVNATASAFLGLTVNCARCHDHKFDPIQQADYYRIASIFNGVYHGEREVATREQREAFRAKAAPLEASIAEAKAILDKLRAAAAPALAEAERRVRLSHREPVTPFLTEESFAPVEARYLRLIAPKGAGGGLDEVEIFTPGGANVARGAAIEAFTTRIADGNPDAYHRRHLNDGAFDKRWFPAPGSPASVTFHFPETVTIAKTVWSTDRLKAFQGRFQQQGLTDYRVEVSSDGVTWTQVAASADRLPARKEDQERLFILEALPAENRSAYETAEKEFAKLESELRRVPKLPAVYAGRMKQPDEPVYLLKGGNVMQRGDEVAPASISALKGFALPLDAPEHERRIAFARWLGDDANPLTPRVIANRVWHYHFGTGIVATPSDFGYNGERPSHPELLDYLASRLIANGWRLKPLHREILLSKTYRQQSAFNADAAKVDAGARLLWRFPPQRLQAESLRDAMLHVAGVLDGTRRGGPSFQLYKYTVDNVATYFPVEKFGPETYRRTVYAQSARSIRTELLSVFDCPDSSLPEPRRVVTTSPLQALSLLNHSFTLDMAEAFAKRIEGAPTSLAFEYAFGRPPSEEEASAAQGFIREHGLAAFARALFNANEFVYVH
jgi:mono/diheme cytochrome c family protein